MFCHTYVWCYILEKMCLLVSLFMVGTSHNITMKSIICWQRPFSLLLQAITNNFAQNALINNWYVIFWKSTMCTYAPDMFHDKNWFMSRTPFRHWFLVAQKCRTQLSQYQTSAVTCKLLNHIERFLQINPSKALWCVDNVSFENHITSENISFW